MDNKEYTIQNNNSNYNQEETFKKFEEMMHQRDIKNAIEYFSNSDNSTREGINYVKNRSNRKNTTKRTLKNTVRKVLRKAYKLSKNTKNRIQDIQDFFVKNGKRIVSWTVALGLAIGVAAYEADKAIDGMETYNTYGSIELIKDKMTDIVEDEFKIALDNPEIEVELETITPESDFEYTQIVVIDPNNPEDKMYFNVGGLELGNPRYMRKIAAEYRKVDRIKNKNNIFNKIKAGKAFNKVKDEATDNDIVINEALTYGYDMDTVDPRITISQEDQKDDGFEPGDY